MSDSIKLSVIIPVYNVENYIEKCILSIVNQTYKDLEIIVVNDGSNDNSGIILDKLAEKYEKIKVIHKPNGGVSSARNAGLEVAKGKYIGFVDGDDWLEPNTYEEMINVMVESNSNICYAASRYDGEDITKWYFGPFSKVEKNFMLRNFAAGTGIAHVGTTVYEKQIIGNTRFDEKIAYWEDLDFQIRVLNNAETVYLVEKPYYHLVLRSDSATAVRASKKSLGALKISYNLREIFGEEEYGWLCDNIQYKMLLGVMVHMAQSGIREEDAKVMTSAIKSEAKVMINRGFFNIPFKTKGGIVAIWVASFSPMLANIILRIRSR